MIVIEQDIKDYLSINIETTNENWDENTTYNFGDIRFYNHHYYRSVIDNNLGNIPVDSSSEWLMWKVSNRYAQIDLRSTTYTVWNTDTALDILDDGLISSFVNTGYDNLAFGGVTGENITIYMYDQYDALQYTFTKDVYDRPDSNNWHGYYFDPFSTSIEESFLFRLPPVDGGYIEVKVQAGIDTGVAEVGYMLAGNEVSVGESSFGASLGLEDNSIITIDDFGITTVTKRTANSFMDIDVSFPSYQVKQMERKAHNIFGKIVLFIGDESEDSKYEHLATLGYVEGYTAILSGPTRSSASYSIREVI